MNTQTKKNILPFLLLLAVIIVINIVGNFYFKRFDLTQDKRYTLSESTIKLIENIEEPVFIDVFLDGNFPPEFKRLQNETRQILEEFRSHNSNLIFQFTNPLEDESQAQQYVEELVRLGFIPTNINSNKKGKKELIQIFPWAIANQNEKSVRVPLLINNFGNSPSENINSSVQLLEFAFADAITKITTEKKKRIAVLKGNGQLADKYQADYLLNLREYYQLGEFNLDSLQDNPQKILENLNRFDAALIVKPTEAFSDNEKYILDQFVMKGGKTMWLIDKVVADIDSLQNENSSTLAFPRELNLDDLFFKYGVRINYQLVQDLLSTPITAQSAQGDVPIDWLYSPIIKSDNNHTINKNINLIKLEFANTLDTLKNGIKKTVLLKSSPQSKAVGAPLEMNLYEFMEELDEQSYNKGNQNIGVLLEGKFTSGFKNRVKPFSLNTNLEDGKENKMIVIADGDIVNYNYVNKKPLNGGIDQWTQQVYGNKEFLLNAMNYLLDDSGLINIRNKEVKLAFLDKEKVAKEYTYIQLLTVGMPIVLLFLFAVLFAYLRKRKYAR
ncbi:gliding motility-associated ABC transporter substrate-binding protein GldG [Flavobacterium azooxidireducens]|uniref:Gliding motility-associated ABC transporter substrate-binding protein GldG n=1 Tax=Flavobacterium azooxidireducens TaxID=1871076 RepID=A0ABY4KCI8_9FLAO|nr:gliding motility-associated ABC transporter substrate-binding protein GldG [Flavobacterium azooxidireducens]UPQ78513.1 gliding motility-associated ABC transporter substrate-binding protein GldG [Flavobacterium azooxidireducens]